MATMTIRLPDEKHHRLRLLAQRNGVSLNKLVNEWASMTLAHLLLCPFLWRIQRR
jgi:predicted HicB family RNase H-like nuclease